jgi:dTDP-4-dehydrorhamnose 3,5-epimerase
MKVAATAIPDLPLLEPTGHGDAHGFFYESFHQQRFDDAVR